MADVKQTVAASIDVVEQVNRVVRSAGETVGQVASAIARADQPIANAKAALLLILVAKYLPARRG